MSDERTVKKICTKENPMVPPPKNDEIWTHEGLEDKYPESDSSIVIFHCPNCGEDIPVDMSY